MKCIVHADDYGLSKGITDNILDSHDNGILSRTSIIANGYAFHYAIREYKKRPGLDLAIHLNLVEGKPILPIEKVNMLVDKRGEFYHSFFTLWKTHISANQNDRRILEQQVKLELDAQIRKIKKHFDKSFKIQIDSHQHFHMIPFVFNSLLELNSDIKFSYIRVLSEPFFFCFRDVSSIKSYLGPNILKHFLLGYLSKKTKKKLSDLGIKYCDYFVGILFTGNMSESVVISALSKIPMAKKGIVEILFHPGGAIKKEGNIWKNKKKLKRYYYSPHRIYERNLIKSQSLKGALNNMINREKI